MSEFASMNKQSAYREIASNYAAAREILKQKKLAYGEGAVVPFYFPDRSASLKTIELLEGIGSINGDVMILSNILGVTTNANDAQVNTPDSSTTMSIQSVIAEIYRKIGSTSVYDALMQIKESIDDNTAKLQEMKTAIDSLYTTTTV